jgi:hypothetical protein
MATRGARRHRCFVIRRYGVARRSTGLSGEPVRRLAHLEAIGPLIERDLRRK